MVWLRGVARQLGSINQQRFPGLIMNRTMFSASKNYGTDFIIVAGKKYFMQMSQTIPTEQDKPTSGMQSNPPYPYKCRFLKNVWRDSALR